MKLPTSVVVDDGIMWDPPTLALCASDQWVMTDRSLIGSALCKNSCHRWLTRKIIVFIRRLHVREDKLRASLGDSAVFAPHNLGMIHNGPRCTWLTTASWEKKRKFHLKAHHRLQPRLFVWASSATLPCSFRGTALLSRRILSEIITLY